MPTDMCINILNRTKSSIILMPYTTKTAQWNIKTVHKTFSTIPLIISHFRELENEMKKTSNLAISHFICLLLLFFHSIFIHIHIYTMHIHAAVLMLSRSLSILIESFFFEIVFADIINTKSWYHLCPYCVMALPELWHACSCYV